MSKKDRCCAYKQLLDEVFAISGIIKVEVTVISRSRISQKPHPIIVYKHLSFLLIRTLGKCYQPQPPASADNSYLDLDYFGYRKNLIQ